MAIEQIDTAIDVRQYIRLPNVADYLEDETLDAIGGKVFKEYEIDRTSRAGWEEKMQTALDMAMQVTERKSDPWPNAANIKYPLMTSAAIQFAARAYPAIVGGRDIVKGKIIGSDDGREPDPQNPQDQGVSPGEKQRRADRVGRHMSYQLLDQMEEWEDGTDKLLHILPIVGLVFRKVYFDTHLDRNVSELVPPERLIVNNNTKTLETAPRITEVFDLYPYEIEERKRRGLWLDVDLGTARIPEEPKRDGMATGGDDEDAPHTFLEQHRYIDLDEDGYPEPYIVTIHKDSSKVVRIVARFDEEGIEADDSRIIKITPVHYYIKYSFIPAPDGGFYDMGFGLLLGPINATVNGTLNQLLDAGRLQIMGGGFIGSELRMKSGPIRFKPGEYKRVQSLGGDIRRAIVPLDIAGPSQTLFALLGLLIDAGKDIASVKDVLTGNQDPANTSPTTTLALIEQGLKVFSAIYKRVHRSLKKELKMLYRLNRLRLPPTAYFNVLDTPEAISFRDYDEQSVDVVPVSDPTVVTDTQRLGRAEFLMSFVGNPMVDSREVLRRVWAAANIEDADTLFAKDQGTNPAEMAAIAELDIKAREIAVKEQEVGAKVGLMAAQAALAFAKAEGEEPGQQLAIYEALFKTAVADNDAYMREKELVNARNADTGGDGGLAPEPGNPQGATVP